MNATTRVVLIIFAVVGFFLLDGHNSESITNEEAFTVLLLVCGVVTVVVTIVERLRLLESYFNQMLDIYRTVAAAAMVVTSILFLKSVSENKDDTPVGDFARRLTAGILGIIYGLAMANISWILLTEQTPARPAKTE